MIGQTLGRYRILEQLGRGGAGIVYRAEDPRLGRSVAIKVLHDQGLRDERALARFRQEARSLSRLLHPNIATLFDFDSHQGCDFIVLEYVAGETLAQTLAHGPLPESRAKAIAIEVAEALQFAHEEGIVHRDLKPGNIILTPRGRAKVLDFGLARLLHEDNDATAATENSAGLHSDGGSLTGTFPYMSPEQVEGRPVDARADIYALGVVMFEMLSGTRPYEAANAARLLYQIAHEKPRPLRTVAPSVSSHLEGVVMKCLKKDPAMRFPAAVQLATALREPDSSSGASTASQLAPANTGAGHTAFATNSPALETSPRISAPQSDSSGSSKRIRAIAVLPLENRSGDPEQEFFADGMTDALIADLAQIGSLRVISRTSSMRFKGTRQPLPEIARELHVDAIVEGSVLRSGNRVRITAELVHADSDTTLWAKSYDTEIGDILSLQREIARTIAEGVRAKVTPEEEKRFVSRAPVNPAAHVAYLRGRYCWNRWDTRSLHESIVFFQQALDADPAYPLAWAGLADAYNVLGNTNALPPMEAYSKAREAALRGLALEDSIPELHASLAYVHRHCDWDWPAAEREFLRALQLNPGYATARSWYARFLSGVGRHGEAIEQALRSLEADPLSLIIHTVVGDALFYSRKYEESVLYFRKSLEMDSTFGPGHTDLARSLDLLGRPGEALHEFLQVAPPVEGKMQASAGLATLLLRAGRGEEARAMMGDVLETAKRRFVSPYGIASYFAVAGQTDSALQWLSRAHTERDGAMVWIKVHPRLDSLRQEPQFRELLVRMKLE
jgi:serine/threonine-protein kinase